MIQAEKYLLLILVSRMKNILHLYIFTNSSKHQVKTKFTNSFFFSISFKYSLFSYGKLLYLVILKIFLDQIIKYLPLKTYEWSFQVNSHIKCKKSDSSSYLQCEPKGNDLKCDDKKTFSTSIPLQTYNVMQNPSYLE